MNKIKFTPTRLFVAAFLLCGLMIIQTPAAPGDLDPSFGNGGKVITSIGGSNASASDTAIQTDGKIVAAVGSRSGNFFTLARYNTDGSLDTSFGTGGIVLTPISSYTTASAVAIQSDGKIVAAGSAYPSFALARYNTNGSLDTTFGTGGIVVIPFDGPGYVRAHASAVAIQSDGKIVAAGWNSYTFNSDEGYSTDFALVRCNTNGSLDTSFGIGGKVTTYIRSDDGYDDGAATDIAIQSDGKIVAAGTVRDYVYPSTSFVLVRYNTNGSPDTSFGTGGIVLTPIGSYAGAYAVVIQSDGKIVAAGYTSNTSVYNFALARYNTDGSLDTTFGTGGVVLTPIGNSNADAYAVAIQSNGKIVVAGAGRIGSNNDFVLARYNTDGSLDTSFGSGGVVLTPIGNRNDGAYAVAIQPDGKIVAAGFSYNGTNDDFALARYQGGTSCIPSVTITLDKSSQGDNLFDVTAGVNSVIIDPVRSQSGLQTLTLVNATNAVVSVPVVTPDTTTPVSVTYTITNPNQPVDITLRATGVYEAISIRLQCGASSGLESE